MNERTITVKGMGNVTAKPDLTIITMKLITENPDYAETMERATKDAESIRQALISIGYEREALKTTDFKIRTETESYQEYRTKNWLERFKGYSCTHELKLKFDFDMKRLGETINAISACGSKPKFQIAFSVKDKDAVSAELLENAVNNAKDKAAVLAKAADVQLGTIKRIDYSWGELRLFSETQFDYNSDYDSKMICCEATPMEIEPEEFQVTDSITVIWTIE